MHHEIDRAAVARMLNLGDVLQLVDDRFDNRPLAQQQLVTDQHQRVLHVGFELGHAWARSWSRNGLDK